MRTIELPKLSPPPGAIIGHTSRGPIRLQAGGDGNGEGQPSGGGSDPASGQAGTQTDPPSGGQTPPAGQDGDPKTYGEDYVKQLRDEAAGHRTKLRTAEQERDQHKNVVDAINKALNPDAKDGQADPGKLQEQLTGKDEELRTLRVERAAEKAARKHGGDPDALLDSRAFLTEVGKLDPAADDFTDKLDQAVKTAVDNNPKLKTSGQAPARSGAEITGGSGGTRTFTRAEIKNMSAADYDKNRDAIMQQLSGGS